jgi:hypothetical protein
MGAPIVPGGDANDDRELAGPEELSPDISTGC